MNWACFWMIHTVLSVLLGISSSSFIHTSMCTIFTDWYNGFTFHAEKWECSISLKDKIYNIVHRNQKSEICLFNSFISYIEYSLIYIYKHMGQLRQLILLLVDTTPTMKKYTKYHILYQNNNMLLHKKKQINKKINKIKIFIHTQSYTLTHTIGYHTSMGR